VEIHALEGIAGLLRPDTILLHRDLVDLDIIDLELARLLVHPEIYIVVLVLAARLAEVGTHKVFALLLEVPHRLMDLDEVERQRLSGLVILDVEVAVRVLIRSDVVMDGTHHLPGTGYLHAAGMLLHRWPPPADLHSSGQYVPIVT